MDFYNEYEDDYSDVEEDEEYEDGEEFETVAAGKAKTKKFDEKSFDYRVAKSITEIHKKPTNDFDKWVKANFNDLVNLYQMSELTIPMETFFTFIYDHS